VAQQKRTAEIFEKLSRGNFICSNAVQNEERYLYQYIEENQEALQSTFLEIGYELQGGNNFYFFSKSNESSQGKEKKIEKALRWLDVLAFFTSFRKDLCRGARFSPHDILQQLDVNLALKDQLTQLSKRSASDKNYQEMLLSLLKELQREGFIDVENDLSQTWKILDAWDYMEQLVLAVNILDDNAQTTDS